MTQEPSILLATLSNDWRMHIGASKAFWHTASLKGLKVRHAFKITSLIANGCNHLLCEALNDSVRGLCTHFALQHSDIVPEDGWLDILLEESEKYQADMISAVIAMKDDSGECSMAENPSVYRKKMSLKEVNAGPATFQASPGDACGVGTVVVNTGLMLIDLRNSLWHRRQPKSDKLIARFESRDEIIANGTHYQAGTISEDWRFSQLAHSLGLRIFATSKVRVDHWGHKAWSNRV